MPLLSIRINNGIIDVEHEVSLTTFKELSLKEADVEEYIRKNIASIFEDENLLIVGQQVRNSKNGICDLVAIDGEGNLVLIEVKRDEDDMKSRREAFEFQAIRYAASFAKIQDIEDLVDKVFVSFIEKNNKEFKLGDLTPREFALRRVQKFLTQNNAIKSFNEKQRIILMASSFDEQTLSAVAWLIKNGVEISCLKLQPLKMGKEVLLDIERVLPPVSLDMFFIDINSKKVPNNPSITSLEIEQISTKTYYPRMSELFAKGYIKIGDTLVIRGYEDSSRATIISDKLVEFNGVKMRYNEWGQTVTGWSAIQIYTWAILENSETRKTLHELRLEMMSKNDK